MWFWAISIPPTLSLLAVHSLSSDAWVNGSRICISEAKSKSWTRLKQPPKKSLTWSFRQNKHIEGAAHWVRRGPFLHHSLPMRHIKGVESHKKRKNSLLKLTLKNVDKEKNISWYSSNTLSLNSSTQTRFTYAKCRKSYKMVLCRIDEYHVISLIV